MAKRGNIFYTDKDFTDSEVQQQFGFPVILILHDNNSVIKKISAFDENGIKSIYDFSLSASKQFVTDSIATAISNLKDNTLEFPTFADFPQPGELGNIYIDLSEDKIYIWDSSSNSYTSQSWNQAIITGIQSQISAIYLELDTKLDKPTDVSLNNIPRRGDGPNGARFENSVMFQYDGKVSVGTASNPTEKLDVGGRVKSDGQVFNETSSAILPKEIKFKNGKFKAALADGVEKSVLLEGDVQNNILRNLQSNNINFCGFAPFGSAENAAVWTVTKITVAANGTITKQTFTNVTWSSVPF